MYVIIENADGVGTTYVAIKNADCVKDGKKNTKTFSLFIMPKTKPLGFKKKMKAHFFLSKLEGFKRQFKEVLFPRWSLCFNNNQCCLSLFAVVYYN